MKSLLPMIVCFIVLCLGCYETKFTLSDPGTAKVDRSLIGDYEAEKDMNVAHVRVGGDDKDKAPIELKAKEEKTRLVVRNLDDRHYYAEWSNGDKAPLRMIAFTTVIKDVTFVHLRELTGDGAIPEKHLIMRVALSPDKNTLSLRNLSEAFFKSQTIESDEQLRSVIETHVNDEAMYDKEPATMNRVEVKK